MSGNKNKVVVKVVNQGSSLEASSLELGILERKSFFNARLSIFVTPFSKFLPLLDRECGKRKWGHKSEGDKIGYRE